MPFKSLSIALLSVGLAAPAVADPSDLDHPALLEAAMKAHQERDAERAIELFTEITERTPGRAEAWVALSIAYERSEQLDEAINAAERAQEIGWLYGPWLTFRVASLHARAGHTDQALSWLERALAERYEERPTLATAEDFAALKDDPRFRRLAGLPPVGDVGRDDRWRFDLNYLVEEVERMHGDPERPAFDTPFREAVNALRSAIPTLSDDDLYLGMMRLLAILNDGHTAIYGPDPDTPYGFNGRKLPFKFYWFPEGLYIVDGVGAWAEHAGSRVVRFGDLDADEVLDRMASYRGMDNAMTWRWMSPQFYVGQLLMLRAVGATTSDSTVSVTLEARDGAVTTQSVEGGAFDIPRKLRPSPAMTGDTPRWLTRVDDNYWLEPLPEHGAVYLQFNQVRDGEQESIEDMSRRLRDTLRTTGARMLIVDVRHNNGGNNSLLRPLVRAMVAFEMEGANRRVVVITGRNTFSAAQNFINRVEQWTDAWFAGEPSSSSPNFTGEETNLLLPFSRLRGSISTRYWQDAMPGDTRPWIPMDIPVELSADDYFAGRDVVLERVLDVAASR